MIASFLALPTYDVAGEPGKELIVNLLLYGMALALLLSVAWVLLPFVTTGRKVKIDDER